MIYRPGVHNLQTRTVSFPDQEKFLQKVDGGELKIFINARTPQTKHCLFPKYVIIYRPYFYNLHTRKKS